MKILQSLVFFACLFTATAAVAQKCPTYLPNDRAIIKKMFVTTTSTSLMKYKGGVLGILSRLDEITYLGSANYLRYPTQRQAFEAELKALVAGLNEAGANPPSGLSHFGKKFIQQVVNTSSLGIQDITVFGDSEGAAITNSQVSNTAVVNALSTLWRCF